MTDTKCEACATQGPLIEALTRDNQRLRHDVSRLLAVEDARQEQRERAEKAEAEVQALSVDVMAARALARDAEMDAGIQRERAEKAEARVAELEQELQSVLGDWNALTQAIGAKTNGTAIGEAAALKKRVAELEAALIDLLGALPKELKPANNEHAARIEKVLRGEK